MAWTKSTVGDAASGADFAADLGALQLWDESQDGVGGEQEAEIITDIEDDWSGNGWTANSDLWIHGDLTGKQKRTITAPAAGGEPLFQASTGIDSCVIEDLWIDASAAAAGQSGIYLQVGGPGYTGAIRRVWVFNPVAMGLNTAGALDASGGFTFENMLVTNPGTSGFFWNYSALANTVDYKNCGIVDAGANGFDNINNANITANYYNCYAFNSVTQDWAGDVLPTLSCDSCVCSDTTLTLAAIDNKTDLADSKTDYATYFVDYANYDCHLTANENALWGITGNSTYTPALDLEGKTRVDDIVGPYEHICRYGGRVGKQRAPIARTGGKYIRGYNPGKHIR